MALRHLTYSVPGVTLRALPLGDLERGRRRLRAWSPSRSTSTGSWCPFAARRWPTRSSRCDRRSRLRRGRRGPAPDAGRLRESAPLDWRPSLPAWPLVGGVAALAGAATGSRRTARAGARGERDEHGHDDVRQPGTATGSRRASAGYTLVPDRTRSARGADRFRFRILDALGQPVRDFDLDGGVRLHLIVVRRDLTGYQHLHPVWQLDGSWSVPLTLARPAPTARLPTSRSTARRPCSATTSSPPGISSPAPPASRRSTRATDGYDVELEHGALHAGEETRSASASAAAGIPSPVRPVRRPSRATSSRCTRATLPTRTSIP